MVEGCPDMQFSIIVASTSSGGIGIAGGLPWKSLPGDMAYFRKVTTTTKDSALRNAVVMGRKTYMSIPAKYRPLKGRFNVVLTRDPAAHPELEEGKDLAVCTSLPAALERVAVAFRNGEIENTFVTGGSGVYTEALTTPGLEKIYLTKVEKEIECDTFFKFDYSHFNETFASELHEENGIPFRFVTLEPLEGGATRHEEYQYLDIIRECIDRGVSRGDRTGTGTVSVFGRSMRYNLRDDVFPLFTTKRVFWRGVAEELLWFVKGSTNANQLADKKIHIWDGNGSREFLDQRGFKDREVGDLGPVYGFQWRHFGAEYKDMHADYTGQGYDQLAECIRLIKENPTSRRIVLSAWNPADLGKMALPPCHMFCQFYVANGELSCQMYQRSADMGLGVPFNVASYSLLTRMMAQVCDLKAGDFVHVIGDTHVYKNHVEPLKTQLEREPRAFPKLIINPDVKDIDGFEYKDFTIEGYKPHPRIKMEMAV